MFALNTIVVAIAALAATAQGAPTEVTVETRQVACPAGVQLCGWRILNELNCSDKAHLFAISPLGTTEGQLFDAIYETDPTGYVWRFVQQCGSGKCNNFGLGVPATVCRA
ncbi:hypothetical protein SMACR_00556 [Sordaria macrospora]|uniref:WGS project CABT00000000 data, contig 2.1 n=2 Tax=Sordaria macrospora TaxID=5147 RepID=F7VLG3_SORMK|nr:uncharacterized protein SMAC_00556 [Sordaria macrospora k-hell]KAA8635461.1 hypothetical protein SMACR_00556 [Sordaria macrospora]KAH7627471.1 hypothetical protein B0T09DRAFT_323577 [Sordaria sp. MPI-SDFR-AT-0083]WPJ59307.1 hypothetical protein SMAC4_00556 [Sordaria macrospora]CCC06341.1 unnamed protein product [Sordaria macrospora k-hell]